MHDMHRPFLLDAMIFLLLFFFHFSFIFPSFFLHFSLIFPSSFLDFSLIFSSFFLRFPFIFSSFFLHFSLIFPSFFFIFIHFSLNLSWAFLKNIRSFLHISFHVVNMNLILAYKNSWISLSWIFLPPPPLNHVLSLNSLFWSLPTVVHRLDASALTVPSLYISW